MKNIFNQIDENQADTLQALLELNLKVLDMQIKVIKPQVKPRTLVYGIGVNDSGYPVHTRVDGKHVMCPFYRRWTKMLERCYSTKWHSSKPTYIGCTVDSEWHLFSNFKNWMMTQDYEGKQLDKDVLIAGNKIYSPSTCVFIDAQTNTFLLDSAASRSKYGQGIEKKGNKFRAQCSNNGKNVHIGTFDSPHEAAHAYFKYKLKLAYELAKQQPDERVAVAILSRFISSRRANIHVKSN